MARGSEYYQTWDWSGDIAKRRLALSGIPAGAEPLSADVTTAKFVSDDNTASNDWRVRLTLPTVGEFRTSHLLEPLKDTNNSVVFPLQPTITINHVADYNTMTPVHSNYPFPQYMNSRVDDINIVGEFPVQSPKDGTYWAAAVHFFRSVTKMFYGDTSNKGSPPPICKLNGYGDFVLNNVPVVITSFSTELPNNVDYIRCPITYRTNDDTLDETYTMVPTLSSLNIVVKPVYSRGKVESFSLDKFVNGQLMDKGFI